MNRQNTCPTPSKARYATEEGAHAAAGRLEIRDGKKLKTYPCLCGWFHLTRHTQGRRSVFRAPVENGGAQ